MLTRALLLILLTVPLGCGGGDDDGPRDLVEVKVMTRNLFLGAELSSIILASTADEIPARVLAVWNDVTTSNPMARMALIADEIAREEPHLVGLQEVELFRTGAPNFDIMTPAIDATEVRFDFRQLLLDALAARGKSYRVATAATYTDVELPRAAAGAEGAVDLRMTDHDVILARADVVTENPQGKRFDVFVPLRIPLQMSPFVSVPLHRGWHSVEAVVDGARFTFANSHLEVGGGADPRLTAFQEGQAEALIASLKGVRGPLVLVGDFNSDADGKGTRSYGLLADRFTDAWKKVRAGDPGATCCSGVRDEAFRPSSRIDLVLFRGGVEARAASVTGTDPAARAAAGVWPSDHAGVAATLGVPR